MLLSGFAKMMAFDQPFQGLYAITLASMAVEMTAYNAAMSINTVHAIKGSYPDFMVDYPSITLNKGLLLPAAAAIVEAADPRQIRFSWADNLLTDIGFDIIMKMYCSILMEKQETHLPVCKLIL